MTPEQQQHLLDLTPTDALYDALLVRFDSAIFSGVKAHPVEGNLDQKLTSWRIRGDYVVCQGLACGVIAECQKIRDQDEQEITSEDL